MDYKQCWTCGRPMIAVNYDTYGGPRWWFCECQEERMSKLHPSEKYLKAKARFDAIQAINAAEIVDSGAEIHPAGTRAELDALRAQVAALEAERDDAVSGRAYWQAQATKRGAVGIASVQQISALESDLALAQDERDAARAEVERLREARTELVSAARFVLRVFTGQPFDRGEYADALNALVIAMTPQEFEGTFTTSGSAPDPTHGGDAPLSAPTNEDLARGRDLVSACTKG